MFLMLAVLGNFLCLSSSQFEVKRFPFWCVSLDVPQTKVTNCNSSLGRSHMLTRVLKQAFHNGE